MNLAKAYHSRSESYTRTRLLNQLGYFQPPKPCAGPSEAAAEDGAETASSSSPPPPLHQGTAVFETRLNDCSPADADGDSSSSSSAHEAHSALSTSLVSQPPSSSAFNQDGTPTLHRIQFKETVQVIPIPSRHQFSDRIKSCIWSNKNELQEMAQRNMQEFETEGYDWENVVLDDEMYVDSTNGSLIHPCHIDETFQRTTVVSSSTSTSISSSSLTTVNANDAGDTVDTVDTVVSTSTSTMVTMVAEEHSHEPTTNGDKDEDEDEDSTASDDHFVPLQRHAAMAQ